MPPHPLTPPGTAPARAKGAEIVPGRAVLAPILAIDYGRRRIGLALSDALGLTARPLAVYARVNRRQDLAALRDVCRRHNVGKILVGWPLHLDGSAGEMAEETERFAARLRTAIRLPVELVDERLTTWEARQTQERAPAATARPRTRLADRSSAPRRPGKYKAAEAKDDIAAAVILTDYLSRAGRGPEEHPQE